MSARPDAETSGKARAASAWLLLAVLLLAGCASTTVDGTRGGSEQCERHHVQMGRNKVPVVYGLMGITPYGLAHQAASTNSFPHAEDGVPGGCIVRPLKWVVVFHCPQCERARQEWVRQNPRPR